jgi:dTDP-glucose 4,6-dehydratase/UDP-glucuronate decarboxylase
MNILYKLLENDYKNCFIGFDTELLKNKTIFITGSNGLIGSNIINYLAYLNNTYSLNLKIIGQSLNKPVSWLPQDKNYKYLEFDLSEGIDKSLKFDFLIHAATYAQPKRFLQNQLKTVKLNTQSLIELLALAQQNNATVLFLSSSEIYGNIPDEKLPVSEEYNGDISTITPRATYAESKRVAETICSIYKRDGLDIKIARIAIAYGPGTKVDDTRFINEFIKKSLLNHKIEMLDGGKALRSLCFITDISEMLLNILVRGQDLVYNVGNDNISSILEIAEIISKNNDVTVILPEKDDNIEGTPKCLILDTAKYKKEFNKNRFVTVEEGLKKTNEWIKMIL